MQQKPIKQLKSEFISTKDFMDFFEIYTDLLKEVRDDVTSESDALKEEFKAVYESNKEQWDEILGKVALLRDGKDYMLTEEDKKQIASLIPPPPIVEKIIERIEVIKEQPIVTEVHNVTQEVREVAKYEDAEQLRDKLEGLEGENRLDKSAVKGIDELEEKIDRIDKRPPVIGGGSFGIPQTGGTGAVDSVNGQTGVVVLDTGDIAEVTDKNYVTDAEKADIADIQDKVPYTGATSPLDLGTQFLNANNIRLRNNGSHAYYSDDNVTELGSSGFSADSKFSLTKGLKNAVFDFFGLTTTREFALPDQDGTIALTTDIVNTDNFGIVVDGGGSVLTTGIKGYRQIPWNCTITGWVITGDVSGDVVFTVKKSDYASFPTMTTISGTEQPTLSASQKNENLALTDWTTSLTSGDIVEFSIDSVSTLTKVTLTILVNKV